MRRRKILLFLIGAIVCVGCQAAFFPVDLKRHATTGFSDSVANDFMGGWFDEGTNDLRNFPVGKRSFAGVPFEIIDPVKNSGASCIVLRSFNRPYFTDAVRAIPVNRDKIDSVHFLHTSGWGDDKLQKQSIFRYEFTYDDGTIFTVPVRLGMDVGNWWAPRRVGNAELAWADYNPVGRLVGVWRMSAKNLHPEKKIRSLSVISENTAALPGILAVTLQQGRDLPAVSSQEISLPVARDSKEITRISAAACAVKQQKQAGNAARQKELDQLRRAREEYRIVNELLASGS
ncbi:MAG: hypothetical protein PHS41_06575, partial [Victivallaceae bacterium]|nr:hypothetical protein [Victivallaceae bacterium]